MKPSDCVQLEKSKPFKRDYLKGIYWWKSILLIAPACFLFVGLAGVIYLLEEQMLATWYVIPYVAFFVVGTIWLKAVKKHLQDKVLNAEGTFLVCMAARFLEKDGYVSVVFTTGDKRHDNHFIKKIANKLSSGNNLSETDLTASRKKALPQHDDESGTDFYVRTYFHANLSRRNAHWRDEDTFPILYINPKKVEVIKKRDFPN